MLDEKKIKQAIAWCIFGAVLVVVGWGFMIYTIVHFVQKYW